MSTKNYQSIGKITILYLFGATIWLIAPAGIFLIASGMSMWGWAFIVFSFIILAMVLDGRLSRVLEHREVEKRRIGFMILLWSISTALILFVLYLSSDVLRLNVLWLILYGVVFLVLMGMAALTVIKSD